jgi:hypothetical protein
MPNSPNSSPELTEVAREAIERHFVRRFGATIGQGPSRLVRCLGQTAFNPLNLAEAVVQALSTKNELPSFTCDMCDDPATCPAENCAFRSKETILSLQRRLDERDALLAECGNVFRSYERQHRAKAIASKSRPVEYEERHRKAVANGEMADKIDAALNPKDTGR